MAAPSPESPPLPRALVLASAVLVAAWAWLVAPSVAWFDSGELAAAAVQLGVPHPNGFALFDLAGHTLARLPLGPAAWRVHLLGVLAAVTAVALIWRTWPEPSAPPWMQRLIRPAFWLVPLAIPAVAMHLRATEVYAPTWLIAAASLWAWHEQSGARRTLWLVLLAGFGAGIHVEAALVPGLAAIYAWWLTPRPDKLRTLVTGVVLITVALLAIAYLPLAAARKPAFSWGDVRTLTALRDHLTAASIREAFADRMGHHGWTMLGHLVWRETKWLLPFAVVGVVSLERRQVLVPLAALMVVDALYSALVNPMGLRDDQAGLLVLLGLGLLAARGLAVTVAWRPAWLGAPALGLVAVHVGLLLAARPDADLRAGGRLADRLLRNVPPGSVLFAASDHTSAACIWLQTAEGARPDSPCFPLALLRDPRMLRLASDQYSAVGLADAATVVEAGLPVAARVQAVLAAWPGRPVGWETGSAAEDSAVLQRLHPDWPWMWLDPHFVDEATRHADADNWLPALRSVCPTPAACVDQPTLRHVLATSTSLLAATRMQPDPSQARALLEAAVVLADDDPKVLNNLAALEVQSEHPERALALCERALAVEPDYARAHRTAARAALFLHRDEEALRHAEAYVAARPARETRPWLEELAKQVPPDLAAKFRALAK